MRDENMCPALKNVEMPCTYNYAKTNRYMEQKSTIVLVCLCLYLLLNSDFIIF